MVINEDYYSRYVSLREEIKRAYSDLTVSTYFFQLRQDRKISLEDIRLPVISYLDRLATEDFTFVVWKIYFDNDDCRTNTIQHLNNKLHEWGSQRRVTTHLSHNIHLDLETLRNHRRQHLAHNDAERKSIIYDFDETEKAFYEIVSIFNNLCDPEIDVRVKPISDEEIKELQKKITDGLNVLLKDAV